MVGVLTAPNAECGFGDLVIELGPDGTESNAVFGYSVAAGGETIAVGAPGIHKVYLFDRETLSVVSESTPGAPGAPGSGFGFSVALFDDVLVAGAVSSFNPDGVWRHTGSVYRAALPSASTERLATTGPSFQDSDVAGFSVATSADVIVTGAPRGGRQPDDETGSVHVYDAATGNYLQTLAHDDAERGHFFGASVAVAGDVILVGADHSETFPATEGAAYVFDRVTGQQTAKLTFEYEYKPPYSASYRGREQIGTSVSLYDGTAYVGAPSAHPGLGIGGVFAIDLATGEEQVYSALNDGAALFGESIAVDDGLLLVGASLNTFDAPTYFGGAFLFDTATGLQIHEFSSPENDIRTVFGAAVALHDGVAVIGAAGANNKQGAAYVYDVSNPQLPGDFNGDRLINNADLNLLLNHWGSGELPAEWDGRQLAGEAVANAELNGLLYAWGRGDGATDTGVVPEPTAAGLLSVLLIGVASTRRDARPLA